MNVFALFKAYLVYNLFYKTCNLMQHFFLITSDLLYDNNSTEMQYSNGLSYNFDMFFS